MKGHPKHGRIIGFGIYRVKRDDFYWKPFNPYFLYNDRDMWYWLGLRFYIQYIGKYEDD